MENDLNSLFKKPLDKGMDSLFKKPKSESMDSLFKLPSSQTSKLSSPQIKEAKDNRAWAKNLDDKHTEFTKHIPPTLAPIIKNLKPSTVIASAKGFSHNMDEYGASINKGLGKVAGAVGWESGQKSFDKGAKWWSDQRRMNEIETKDNKLAHLVGELILDPINLTPMGLASKGSKASRIGKSMVAGAGVGYAISKAKNYGNDDLTDLQKQNEDALSVGVVSVLNGVIAGVTKGKVTNAIKDIEHLKGDAKADADKAMESVMLNPEAFGLNKEQAQKLDKDYMDMTTPTVKEEVPINILDDPKAKESIDMGRDRLASQTYDERVGGGSSSWVDANNQYHRSGAKGEKNYHEGFNLTKADVKNIDNGNMTPELEQKIRNDMERLETDPNWNNEAIPNKKLEEDMRDFKQIDDLFSKPEIDHKIVDDGDIPTHDYPVDAEGTPIGANGNTIFANAGHNLAGGFGAGTVNAGSGMYDENDTPDKMADRFIQGMVAGVAGVSGLKLLKKTNPNAYKKVQSWVMDNDIKVGDKLPTQDVQLGVFAGKKAKGFDDALSTHTGKYDGQTRFEIDDSKATVINKGVTTLASKGYTQLDSLLTHDELFSNYPQLRNVIVKFDKNMKEHASFDGESTITLSNKFKSKDELSSSVMHEIQHWVQNKEGFAGGGNFDEMMRKVDGKINDLQQKGNLSEIDAMNYKKDLDYLQNNRPAEAYKRYQNIAGEIEAREVQARKNLTQQERESIPTYENTSSMGTKHGDEAYNDAFMAEIDGRLGDFESVGINPKDASLDFSRTKVDNVGGPEVINNGKHNLDDLERLAKEKGNKGWEDISSGHGVMENLNNFRKSLFSDTLSAKYHESRDLVHTNTNKSNEEIGRLAKVLESFDDASDKGLYQYLTKTGGDDLPQNVKDMGDMIRHSIDNIGAELVTRGDLDEKGYKEWVNAYLYRQYEPNASKGGIGGFRENFKKDKAHERGISKEFKATDVKKMTGWLHENGFLKDSELLSITSTKQMQDFLKSENRAGLIREGKLSITKTLGGKIKLRRDYTKAEREGMGEIESAKIAVPETLARLQRLKQHSDFLRRAKDIEGVMLDADVVKASTAREMGDAGFSRVDANPMYGALSGKWIRNDVYDDIGRTTKDIQNLHHDAFRLWNGYHGLWKKSKTVWNPTAHVNNFAGNLFLMHLGGVNSTQLPKMLSQGAKGMKALKQVEELEQKRLTSNLTQAEENTLHELKDTAKFALEAKNNGIFGKSQLNDILAGMENGNAKKGFLGKLDETASKYYELEDNFNRLSFYQTLRQTGRDAKTSKQMVDFILPDYSKPLPKGWRVARDTSIAPFISWSYYALPSMLKMMTTTKTGAIKATTVIASLSAMEMALTGGEITPLDNIPFIDGKKPEDFKGRRFAIGKAGDKINTVKMDRIIPYADLQNPLNFLQSNISGIAPSAYSTFIQGRDSYKGRTITSKNKGAGDKTLDWAKHSTKQFAPLPMPIMNMLDLLDSKMRSKKSRRRNKTVDPRTALQEALKNIGLNTMTYSKRGLKKEQS